LRVILTAYGERSYSGLEKPREIESENGCGIELSESGIASKEVATIVKIDSERWRD
jgi:hypothetical protein